MKKGLLVVLALIMVLGLVGCSGAPAQEAIEPKPIPTQEESELDKAIALFEDKDYANALIAFRELEQTDEVKEYIKQTSYYILSDYIFKNGEKGNQFGASEFAEDMYYISVPGEEIILSVHPTATSYDYISFSLIPSEPRGILTSEAYSLTIDDEFSDFAYFYQMILGSTVWRWNGEAELNTYTRDTSIDFDITSNPDTAVWQFADTEEETKVSTRDEFNDFLDSISLVLRKLDLGITLQDLGFSSFE